MTPRSTLVVIGIRVSMLAFCIAAVTPAAAVVVPKKPSETRVVMGNSTTSPPCPGSFGLLRVDMQQNPDGTTTPFSVPPKSAFVITSWDFLAGGSVSALNGVDLVLVDAGGTSVSYLSIGRSLASSTGSAGGTVATPDGAIVRGGANLCFVGGGSLTIVVVRGFMTKDK